IDTLDFTGNALSPEINTSGGIERTALMANVLYDIQTGSKLTPYVGAGLGATWTDFDLVYGPGVRINETDTTFSAQLIAGVAYAVTDSTSVTADLRYARAFDVSSTRLNGAGGVTGVVSDDIDALSLNFGVRVGF
ncbi:MAG: outer membrane beta-barrel protein, partial [Pseudomonadota bacterium]